MLTKTCNLTEDEVKFLIKNYGQQLYKDNKDESIERINYLNKRLKAFKEVEITADTDALNPENQKAIKSDNSATGWGTAENAKA